MKKLNLIFNGEEIEVLAEKIKGVLWFHYEGETYQYEPESQLSKSGAGAKVDDPTQIVAPMPGKIIKIFVSEGDSVKQGETVVSMEAMKMEYNLKATQDMKVKSVLCEEQASVGLGEKLVELEE